MNRSDLQQYLTDQNVKAFLMVIRTGEGTVDAGGYKRMFGGGLFDSFRDHPRTSVSAKSGMRVIASTAAGAYQFLTRTWDGLVKQYSFPDFSPGCQDEGAVALIAGRGAIRDVVAGNFVTAIEKCNKEWASLPGSPYGQPVMTMQKAMNAYVNYGGAYSDTQPPAPVEERSTQVKEKDMAPFLYAALPLLSAALPEFAKIFSKPDVAERNTAAVIKAADLIMGAVGATTIQQATEVIQADPQAAEAANTALRVNRAELMDMLERLNEMDQKNIAAAREFSKGEPPIIGNLKFVHILSLLFVLFSGIGSIIVLNADKFSQELKGAIVTLILIGGWTGVKEFWLGSSSSSQMKDELRRGDK